ncbi:MAG: SH3 domain-containing protein [Leptospiraceae bacterium]|nr:SH3 domain-containing protein [Leptospiraceae bacterium]
MQTLRIILAALLVSLLWNQCGQTESNQDSNSISMFVAANSGLVVRDAPNTKGKKLGVLPFGSEVNVVKQAPDQVSIGGKHGRWTQIDFEGTQGWVFGGFLTANVPAKPRAPIVTSLQAGDTACYVDLDYDGRKESKMANFEVCDMDLVGKRILFTTIKGSVAAASCQGDPECSATETVELINSVEIQ